MLPNPVIAIYRAKRVLNQLERSFTPVTWRARYSDTPYAELDLFDEPLYSTLSGFEPHDAVGAGIPRCATCWDDVEQRPTNPACPTCYGTGWTGGYHAAIGLRMYITEGDMRLVEWPGGEQVQVRSRHALYLPRFLILPQDLILVNATGLRYEVDREVDQAGMEPPMVARQVTLLPLLPSHPARAVPIQAVAA